MLGPGREASGGAGMARNGNLRRPSLLGGMGDKMHEICPPFHQVREKLSHTGRSRPVRRESVTMGTLDVSETRDLVRRAIGRDDQAWNLLLIQHGEWLRGQARQLLDPRLKARFDPEDIVQ